MADTDEDGEVTLDTTPIRGAIRYVVGKEEVAPDAFVHFATDGEVRIPAQSEAHARALASALTMVEYEFFGSAGWLSFARRSVLAVMRWLNRRDARSWWT